MKDGPYSKTNVHGWYASTHRPREAKTETHVEGFSTKGNLRKWSELASARSGPKFAPGLGKKPNLSDE